MENQKNKYFLHAFLFVATFLSVMISGTQWAGKNPFDVMNWINGLEYAILLLTFLSFHEFGHYIAARIHGVDATLPYYIPLPSNPLFISPFGTFGAVIKTRSSIPNTKALFDIGIAGPIAGFVVCIAFLIYGFATLPGIEYIYSIHPEYVALYNGTIPETSLHFGDTFLYWTMAELFANPDGFIPPMNEIYHYPYLNVGWFGLFVTSLNLLPMGQLDGGHITYSMFGTKKHLKIARTVWWMAVVVGSFGILGTLHETLSYDYENTIMVWLKDALFPILETIKKEAPFVMEFWMGWLFWAVLAKFVIKLKHPQIEEKSELGSTRKILGWISYIILVLSISYNAFFYKS